MPLKQLRGRKSMSRLSWWLALAGLLSGPAAAQTYPARPVTLIVPYAPGTGIDIVARTIGPKLSEKWGQPIVVDNRAGASGNLGADLVAKAMPNGYTLMVTVVTFAMTPGLTKNLPYDPINDFTPIAQAATGSMAMAINPTTLPVNSLQELIALAKSKPGQLNYASPGNGTAHHLGMELFKQQLGLDIVHVPYRSAAGQVTDVVSGQVPLTYLPVHTALPFAQGGQLKILAVASSKRSILAPDAPSFAELGFPNMDIELWFGIYGPAKLPADVVQRWDRDLPGVLAQPDVKDNWLKQGLVPNYADAAGLDRLTRSEVARWRSVVEKAGITPD
jgi:tripartite-type tricarboxylate transporter receptor subunit TctC